ncbi:S-layer family protein [Scytonema tolypothrichoides VB-61278]|nr:S-layer family protein [Scytonema tolypothrichoides VB-61278]
MNALVCRFFLRLGIAPWCALSAAVLLPLAFSTSSTLAQELKPVADGTLGAESSVVTPTSPQADRIDGGAIRGANLFHSFSQFNIGEGREAYFANPSGIENILSRVTGSDASRIFGKLGVLGNANLFLINPNGIIFGRNASLDVRGSFVGTTANAIGFGNQGFFSATNPNTPPLLTVNPSALLFNQIRAASIQNNSVADSGLNPSSEFTATGLRVPDGRSLLLVGGDINMDGGGLYAFGGRVELGGLASAGTVGLNGNGNNLSLSFPDSVERSDVYLSNGAPVNVAAGNGGSLVVNARNLAMTGASYLFAGIASGLGFNNSKAGNIEVNATGAISLNNRSSINNQVLAEASGQGGNVSISASTLQISGGAQVSASTFGAGKGGNLRIDAQDVQLIGTSADNRVISGLFASAVQNSTGDAGDLMIKTNTLLVRDGAQVGNGTFSAGKGGNLRVDAQDVQLIGRSADNKFGSGLFASAERNSTGDAGDLTIKTNTLLVRDGAQVSAVTSGAGKGGNLRVDAQDVQLIGTSADNRVGSGLYTSAQPNSTGDAGDAGDLTIKTNTLLVRDGAQVATGTFGSGKGGNLSVDAQDVQVIGRSADGRFASGLRADTLRNLTGDAGDLTIRTNTLLVKDGAQVAAGTFGSGKGGNLTVDAQDIQLIGTSANGQAPSGLYAEAASNATGDAGDLTIKTNTLQVKDGAQVAAGTSGAGKGGSLKVDATNIQLIGKAADGQFPGGLFVSADPSSTGDAGDLTIRTNTLLVQDGAQVSAATFGAGKGGSLIVDASDVQLIGTSADGRARSGLGASTTQNSTGDAGSLTIKTNTLLVQDGAAVTVQSLGTGTAGNMTVNARSIRLDNNAFLTANTQSAKVDPNREQATININSQDLIISRNSNIRTNATGENVIGGNINIDTDFLIGFENSDISANSANFRGGNVRVNATGIFGTQFRNVASDRTSDITATGGSPELSGTVQINTPEIDLNSDLVNLPSVPVDTKLAQGCYSPGYAKSSFIITGRGGLPPNPKDILTPDAVQVDWVTLNPNLEKNSTTNISTNPNPTTPAPIVEATGWVFGPGGEVIFTAQAPTQQQNSWQTPSKCHEN